MKRRIRLLKALIKRPRKCFKPKRYFHIDLETCTTDFMADLLKLNQVALPKEIRFPKLPPHHNGRAFDLYINGPDLIIDITPKHYSKVEPIFVSNVIQEAMLEDLKKVIAKQSREILISHLIKHV
jgi:hypothetical protein